MANHKSAKKRARQSVVRNLRNRSFLSSVRTSVKGFLTELKAVKDGNEDRTKLDSAFVKAQSMLQRAATKGVMHRNAASRRVKRLAHARSGLAQK